MRKSFKYLLFALFPLLFLSCSSLSHYERVDAALMQDDPQTSYKLLKASKDSSYSDKEKVLYYLDAGMLAHYAKADKDSIQFLSDAERSIEELYTKSITKTVGTLLVNDNTQDYSGEDYEDIYLNVFKALEYVKAGQDDDAMVEVRRADNKIQFLASKYNEELSTAQNSVSTQNKNTKLDIDNTPGRYVNSALADYMSMVFYRAGGKQSDAELDLRRLDGAFKKTPSLYRFPAPRSLQDELSVPDGKARLNVISFSGFSPIKQQKDTRIFLGEGKWMKVAMPVMYARPSRVARTELVLDSGAVYPLEEIENMSAVAIETFRLHSNVIYARAVLRSLAKTAASVALTESSKQKGNSDASAILSLLGDATQLYNEFSEQADLRGSHYFPGRADVAGVTLDPGVYSFTVSYYDASGRMILQRRFNEFKVEKDKVNLAESICTK